MAKSPHGKMTLSLEFAVLKIISFETGNLNQQINRSGCLCGQHEQKHRS